MAAPLHQRVQVAGFVYRPADCEEAVVAEDEAFAFGPEGGGQAGAFFFGEDDAVEFLDGLLVDKPLNFFQAFKKGNLEFLVQKTRKEKKSELTS